MLPLICSASTRGLVDMVESLCIMAPPRSWFRALITALLTYGVDRGVAQFPASVQDLNNWLAAINPDVNYLGASWDTPLGPWDVRFVACTERIPNTNACGGRCYAFQGAQNGRCLPLPEGCTAVCVAATVDVGMCPDRERCRLQDCFAYVTCKMLLDYGFCAGTVTAVDTQNIGARQRLVLRQPQVTILHQILVQRLHHLSQTLAMTQVRHLSAVQQPLFHLIAAHQTSPQQIRLLRLAAIRQRQDSTQLFFTVAIRPFHHLPQPLSHQVPQPTMTQIHGNQLHYRWARLSALLLGF
ncbi:hypothetical protein BKA70DRAFT_834059 [Coprinopsis sp. MPI-PUGE-AT-0042]|nr:hypothetical protein BKA70DRAFT_834059 [Coprinopsis sp. MPI-PUGE-AT-0042]